MNKFKQCSVDLNLQPVCMSFCLSLCVCVCVYVCLVCLYVCLSVCIHKRVFHLFIAACLISAACNLVTSTNYRRSCFISCRAHLVFLLPLFSSGTNNGWRTASVQ